jgi:uncharacterized membrane protein
MSMLDELALFLSLASILTLALAYLTRFRVLLVGAAYSLALFSVGLYWIYQGAFDWAYLAFMLVSFVFIQLLLTRHNKS